MCRLMMLSFWAASILSPAYATAQVNSCDLVLEGRVIDEHDGSSLSFAEVYAPALERGVVASADGRFEIDGLCPGNIELRITHVGCEPVLLSVSVPQKKKLMIYLEHHHEELKQLEVKAKRPDENVGRTVKHIDTRKIEMRGGADISTLFNSVSGIAISASGPLVNKPVLHGFSGDRLVVVDRGIRQEEQQWGADHTLNLDPLMSSDIRVVKGAASVEYGGGALGGVILADAPSIHDADSLSGAILANLHSNGQGGRLNAFVHAPAGKYFDWRVQLKGGYFGDRRAPGHVLSNTGSRNAGVATELAWKKGLKSIHLSYRADAKELGVLRAAHVGNLTDLNNAIESLEPQFEAPFTYAIDAPRQRVLHHSLSLRSVLPLKESNRIVLTYGLQKNLREEYDRRRGGRSAIPSLDMVLNTQTLKIEHKHHLSERLHGKVGLDGMYQENRNQEGTGVRPLIPYYELRSYGVFWIEHYDLEGFELEAGMRYDVRDLFVARYDADDILQTPDHRFSNTALSVGLQTGKQEKGIFRFNISSAFRAPNVSELYSQGLHHASASIEEGNSMLPTERSVKAIASFEFAPEESRWSYGATVYADRVDDFILLQPQGTRLTIQGAFPLFVYSNTDAAIFGSDLDLAFVPNERTTIELTTSLIRGFDLKANDDLFGMPPVRARIGLERNFTFYDQEIDIQFSATHVPQQGYYPEDVVLSVPPETYTLFDTGFSVKRGRNSIGIHCKNLLNSAYSDYLDRFRYFADAQGRNVTLNYNHQF